jgi:hypothetical protein
LTGETTLASVLVTNTTSIAMAAVSQEVQLA